MSCSSVALANPPNRATVCASVTSRLGTATHLDGTNGCDAVLGNLSRQEARLAQHHAQGDHVEERRCCEHTNAASGEA
jgi:hypothetical protein